MNVPESVPLQVVIQRPRPLPSCGSTSLHAQITVLFSVQKYREETMEEGVGMFLWVKPEMRARHLQWHFIS